MQPLNQKVADAMRAQAQRVRERQALGANFTKTWSLSGKQAIVEPGRDVVMRLCPRWDYALSMVLDPTTNQRVPNPAYDTAQLQFVIAFEHWWDTGDGKTTRAWCPRTLNPECVCAVCVSATVLMASSSKEDQAFGKRIQAREVFVWNACVGSPRKVDVAGLADIRPVSLPGTVFNAISDIMTGGDKSQFARGDITHPSEGYDLSLKRPVGGGGDRWTVQVAAEPSRLYESAQSAAFKGWVTRLMNLEEMLQKETMDPAGIFRSYYGRDPNPGEIGGAPAVSESVEEEEARAATASAFVEPSAAPPEAPEDEFLPPPLPQRQQPPAPQQRPSAPASPAPRPPARPGPRAPRR